MYVFTLPLECSPQETDPKNGEAIVDMENEKKELTDSTEPMIKKKPKTDNEEIISHRYEPKKISVFGRFYFSLKMVFWHILLYFAITVSLYAGFHYGFNRLEKQILLDAFSFLYDWRPLVFFLGIYMSFTVKKISDISAVSLFYFILSVTHTISNKFHTSNIFRSQCRRLIDLLIWLLWQ